MAKSNEYVINEQYNAGRTLQIRAGVGGVKVLQVNTSIQAAHQKGQAYLADLLTRMFLPVGYPNSVSPDYLRYQILNALQAFCNSLASLISSRAILQGFGVGDPTANPTNALLLTVLQDVFSRLTTIVSAHLIGSSLSPEAKTFRLLADLLNDTAVILDTLSPTLNLLPIPGLRVFSLCLSAVFKSLCGIAAGGSKAAITMHFATPLGGKGDVGDLNAKDASKETVLALFGMLAGTLLVPHLTTTWSTYSALFLLVGLHILINYFGVRGLVLRSLNRQRLALVWLSYARSNSKSSLSASASVPTPAETSTTESIFAYSSSVSDPANGTLLGRCFVGSSLASVIDPSTPLPAGLLDDFARERYLLWPDSASLIQPRGDGPVYFSRRSVPRLYICLKEGYANDDLARAWIHAVETCRLLNGTEGEERIDVADVIWAAYTAVADRYTQFQAKLRNAGWETTDYAIMAGLPDAVITSVTRDLSESTSVIEDRKVR